MDTVILGERGQITIPKKMRDRLGLRPKTPVVIELAGNGILVRPAVTVPLREFDDDFVRKLEKEDRLEKGEARNILNRWKKR